MKTVKLNESQLRKLIQEASLEPRVLDPDDEIGHLFEEALSALGRIAEYLRRDHYQPDMAQTVGDIRSQVVAVSDEWDMYWDQMEIDPPDVPHDAGMFDKLDWDD